MLDISKYNELLKQVKPLNDGQLSQLFRYYEMLDVESRVMNLTTITEFVMYMLNIFMIVYWF